MRNLISIILAIAVFNTARSQKIQGKVFDADTKEPLFGVSIQSEKQTIHSDVDGSFAINFSNQSIRISHIGYEDQIISISHQPIFIALQKNNNRLEEIVISANRELVKRIMSPVAISTVSSNTINETKAITIDQLLNKISGVFMVNLGNEQHSMGIRQPMGTRSLFLYLEDGIPVRTSGVFNHNALMEMNMAAVKSIEVIKGPGSSLYGGEAIGGAINMITLAPPAIPTLKISSQLNDIGYRRLDLQSGFTKGKWGINFNGYYASRKNGFIEFSDFHKGIATIRIDCNMSKKTKLENSLTIMDYYSDMTGGVDSVMFLNKSFKSQHTFTYRKAITIRHRTSLAHEWNNRNKSSIHAVYRDNVMGQNPAFRVRDDYRKTGNVFIGQKDLAHGEINENTFKSYVFIGQHRHQLSKLNGLIVGGVSLDHSPNAAIANYISIKKDTVSNKYVSYSDRPDSLLVNYKTDISNIAGFVNFEFMPIKNLRVVSSIRYDVFRYRFNNFLNASSVSGSPDTVNSFSAISPKIGITYNFKKNRGLYANYSRGFVPPQVTELYRAVKIPVLQPSTFINYEIGGWAELLKGKLTADFSIYRMEGKNSIISVRFDDGTFGNANAGATLHNGIELGLDYKPTSELQIRINASYNKHLFRRYVERGIKYDGNQINSAPNWMHNAELTYRPAYLKGFRLAVEWQKMTGYYLDQSNLYKYNGFDVMNIRAGYSYKNAEIWINTINALDAYYAVNASRSNFGRNYTPGEPRNVNLGVSYDFGSLFLKK